MKQSPSSEARSRSVSQYISHLLRNQNIHKSPPTYSLEIVKTQKIKFLVYGSRETMTPIRRVMHHPRDNETASGGGHVSSHRVNKADIDRQPVASFETDSAGGVTFLWLLHANTDKE
jgi:hypothetical protein